MCRSIYALLLMLFFASPLWAAPCYGTRMPGGKKFILGLQTQTIFKRYLEGENGKLRSLQSFLLLSFGFYDWLAVDLKAGVGNVKQRPLDSGEIDYRLGFSGGYGLRLKIYDQQKTKMVLGFQHISVHPRKGYSQNIKHRAILDDWQGSLLISHEVASLTPYIGAKCSRVDYIHWRGQERKRIMSDLTDAWGLILGIDWALTKKTWFNLEGQFIDTEAVALSFNAAF